MANLGPDEGEAESEDWLTTYADAVTLLMSFFILLVSFSKIDIPTFDAVMAGIRDEMGMGKQESTVEEMKVQIQDIVYEMQADQAVQVGQDDRGITLELSSAAFYEAGTAKLREPALPLLARIAQIVRADQYRFFSVDVEGHTDDDPISTPMFPSNWELSAARAAGVVRFFGEQGIELQRLKASGFGETRPKVPNRSKAGEPILENQEVNRRVVVRLSKMSREERGWFLKQVEPDRFVTEDMQSAPPGATDTNEPPPPPKFGPGEAKPEQPAFKPAPGG